MSFDNGPILFSNFLDQDFIDLYFVLSDLVEIPLTEAELTEEACLSSLSSAIAQNYSNREELARDIEHTRHPKAMGLSKQIMKNNSRLSRSIPGLNSLPLNSYGGLDCDKYNSDPDNTIPIGKLVL